MTELVTGSARAYRRDFNSLDFPGWSRSMGPGMGASVASSNLLVTMGTTANSESSIISEQAFTAPSRIVISLGISQKIVNNEVYLEIVADNEDATLDETRIAAWRIAGFDSASASQAITQVQNGPGTARVNTAVSTVANHIGTTPMAIFEIELGQGETWFHTNVADSVNARSSSLKRQVLSPDPSRKYRVRLRFVNAATAPASNTTVYIGHVAVADYTQISAEITAGRGSNAGGQGVPVVVSSVTAGTSGTALGKAEDAVHASGDTGVAVWGVRQPVTPVAATSAAGDYSPLTTDAEGKLIVASAPADPTNTWQGVATVTTAATSVALRAAAAAGIRNYLTDLTVTNTSPTATRVDVLDGATVIWTTWVVGGDTVTKSFNTPLRGTAATALNVQSSVAVTDVRVSGSGYLGI